MATLYKMMCFRLSALLFVICVFAFEASSQQLPDLAEKIRADYKIPELGYAVVSADAVLEINVSGYKKIGAPRRAELSDKFHLGSNTKAITGFIAAMLVKQNKISWQTKFFDLFPELKLQSRRVYFEMTLQDLLTFRAVLPPYTYTNPRPKKFGGGDAQQRLQLAKWFLRQKPNEAKEELKLTNAGYVLAGLMLEKDSGKTYKESVGDLGKELKINFSFDYPNQADENQTWGHDANLKPLAPQKNYKLNWLLAAGNISVDLPDYAKFIQMQLRGLNGKSELMNEEEFNFLHYGKSEFAVGWFWKIDDNKRRVSYNTGNAGAFITKVYVIPEIDRAYIIFANSATEKTSDGIKILLGEMIKKYGG